MHYKIFNKKIVLTIKLKNKMSIISNSFKRNAGLKLAKSMGIEDEAIIEKIVEAWVRGFEVSESMFTEQN